MDWNEIYDHYDIEDIVTRKGVRLKGSAGKKWCVCPLPQHAHHNFSPSFSIYWNAQGRQKWKCHGACGVGGDVIDLIGYLEMPGYNRSVKDRIAAAEILTSGQIRQTKIEVPQVHSTLPQWLWKDMLPPSADVVKYAVSRGLTINEIEKFRIGNPTSDMSDKPYNIFTPSIWMSMPTFHGTELMGIKLRNISHKGLRYMGVQGSRKGLFNFNAVDLTQEVVLIVKGEIACMVVDRFGFKSCAPTGGETGYIREIKHALILAKCIVVGDNDEDPATREKIVKATELRAAMLDADIHYPPLEIKDIDKWLLADTDNAIREIENWIKIREQRL